MRRDTWACGSICGNRGDAPRHDASEDAQRCEQAFVKEEGCASCGYVTVRKVGLISARWVSSPPDVAGTEGWARRLERGRRRRRRRSRCLSMRIGRATARWTGRYRGSERRAGVCPRVWARDLPEARRGRSTIGYVPSARWRSTAQQGACSPTHLWGSVSPVALSSWVPASRHDHRTEVGHTRLLRHSSSTQSSCRVDRTPRRRSRRVAHYPGGDRVASCLKRARRARVMRERPAQRDFGSTCAISYPVPCACRLGAE